MKLLHFADVHLGVTIYGVLDGKTGLNSRIIDFLDAMDCVCDVAEATKPDLILFAGDAFRNRTPVPTLVTHFANRIQRMADVAPVVMVVGNHDRQKGGEGRKHSIDVMRELKAKNQIYVSDSIEAIHFDHSHIITLPWTYDENADSIFESINSCLKTVKDDLPCILLSHAALEGAQYNENYIADLSVEEVLPLWLFCNECFDYVALGHIHKHQEMCPNVVYSGSLERVDWGEKDDPKGFILADVDGTTKYRFVDVHPRPMIEIETNWDDLDAIQDIDVTDAIVKVSIKSKKAIGYQMAISEVEKLLDGYWLLDSVQVISSEERERRQAWGKTVHLEALDVYGLLKIYFTDRYPTDKKKVKVLLKAADKVIQMVNDNDFSKED